MGLFRRSRAAAEAGDVSAPSTGGGAVAIAPEPEPDPGPPAWATLPPLTPTTASVKT